MHAPISEGTPNDPAPRPLATDSGGVALELPYLHKMIVAVAALGALLSVAACSAAWSSGGDGGSGVDREPSEKKMTTE